MKRNLFLVKRYQSYLIKKIGLVYNKGKRIAYAWDSLKLSDEQARKKAELQLLLM